MDHEQLLALLPDFCEIIKDFEGLKREATQNSEANKEIKKDLDYKFGRIEKAIKELSNRVDVLTDKIYSLNAKTGHIEGILHARESLWKHQRTLVGKNEF